jgi:hypothetical protein
MTTRIVAEQIALTQKKFKGKPHGWSPTQVVLYAKLDALITIRRRLFSLHKSVKWTHSNAAMGVRNATHHWRKERARYLNRGLDLAHENGCSIQQLRSMPLFQLTHGFMDGEIQAVSNQLHFVKRKRLRNEISAAIAKRQARFEAGGIRAVLDSVLQRIQRRTNRFDYSRVYRTDGSAVTGGALVHSTLTSEFTNWYQRRELVELAEYLNRHRGIWENAELQSSLPDHPGAERYPPEMTKLFTRALLHISPEQLPQLHVDMAKALSDPFEYVEFRGAAQHRANNKSPGITGLTHPET